MWAILKKSNPKLQPMHELITRDPLKVPVLTDKYWATWPERSGKYLPQTMRLVKDQCQQEAAAGDQHPAAGRAVRGRRKQQYPLL